MERFPTVLVIAAILLFSYVYGIGATSSILASEHIAALQISYYNGTSKTVNAYLALTPSQQTTGLMGRRSMGNCNGLGNCYGMLFIFANRSNACFWMKNTIMPLKQFWITNNAITAAYNATPYSTQVICHTGNEVLETNASSTLQVGDKVRLGRSA